MSDVKRFHTALSLGPKRHVTPDGFLVCEDVPMARTGVMMYGPDETPIPSKDGISGVRISRDADAVFAPDTILSMVGKPVTNDHPSENVSPGNWKTHAVGTVVSARRGEGAMADMLVGDIIITDAQAIQDILEGKKEVSCGYDAEYDETEPGAGRQRDIYYNHLALVDKGRCGPRCSIGDYQPEEILHMPAAVPKKTLLTRVRAFLKDGAEIEKELENSEAAATDELGDVPKPGGDIHIYVGSEKTNSAATKSNNEGGATDGEDPVDPAAGASGQQPIADPAIEARFQGIETAIKTVAEAVQKLAGAGEQEEANAEEMAQEAPPNTDMKTVKDSAVFMDSYRQTIAMAEIIVPGIKLPTFDAKASPRSTVDALCAFRKKVLDLAYAQPATSSVIDELHGKKLDTGCMTCDAVRGLFRSLGVAKKNMNNNSSTRQQAAPGVLDKAKGKINSPADLNRLIAERKKNATTPQTA